MGIPSSVYTQLASRKSLMGGPGSAGPPGRRRNRREETPSERSSPSVWARPTTACPRKSGAVASE